MTITVFYNKPKDMFDKTVSDMVEGRAYQNEDGEVYICSRFAIYAGVSIDGHLFITNVDAGVKYREVDLEITVTVK